ncbi:MAG: YgaP family membrane protein [Paracoccaceae bacterium]
MLKKNVGNIDRIIRAVVGIAALAAFFMASSTGILHWVYLLVGVIGLGTAAMSSCALYSILGKSTCPLENQK